MLFIQYYDQLLLSMKNQAVQTIETGAIFSFKAMEEIEPKRSILPKKVVKKRIKQQESQFIDEPLPYLKPLKQNNQIKLRQLLLPNIKFQQKPQMSKRSERYLSIQQNSQQSSNCVMQLRRYSHYDFISRTDRTLSLYPTQSLVTSRAYIKQN
ncbi:unnamed protein product (macronuclear) [Paramecium tetraurelia]|uniref:Uncharacterized protein n=1 Tax=Paramecium tetraurelia TaxID=5888 RepID=A0BN26_PARTE|nr:uncharacterized protein GSPATT00030581001 [Paramecium tetraurelia]CAK59943.1 unnamed protein product [Paramecium tetraurelia]|eukprot:XP_001427341.1 hypothetical protein (macronuclear) [Paramecium tetraurelia strain d4-2]